MVKVSKFGGTSLAGSSEIENVVKIIKSDKDRKYIIVSAPGKRCKNDTKITDLLYKCADEAYNTGDCPSFCIIEKRFKDIVKELNVSLNIDKYLTEIKEKIISSEGDKNFAASRGEYLNALIVASKLGYKFIDAADLITFNNKGEFDGVYTNNTASEKLKNVEYAVIPGFYGSLSNGMIKTFSRGGSDITGSIIAQAVNADLYENWTDVDGFFTADPNIIENPKLINMLSYSELRELSYMGASVLHTEAVFPVWEKHIPIEIKNTFKPQNKGTVIVSDEEYDESGKIVTGIAGKKDFTAIHIVKKLMNSELGYCRRVLSVLEDNGVSIEHIPTGIDTISLVIESNELKGKLENVLEGIKSAVTYDKLTVYDDLALIALVGHGMRYRVGTAANLFTALAEADINVRMIDQGSSELNIIIGVDNKDYEKSINAIYGKFIC